jgi:hypothetical protein
LQNPMPGCFLDSAASVQSAVHSPNRNIGQLGDQMDTASFFFHLQIFIAKFPTVLPLIRIEPST